MNDNNVPPEVSELRQARERLKAQQDQEAASARRRNEYGEDDLEWLKARLAEYDHTARTSDAFTIRFGSSPAFPASWTPETFNQIAELAGLGAYLEARFLFAEMCRSGKECQQDIPKAALMLDEARKGAMNFNRYINFSLGALFEHSSHYATSRKEWKESGQPKDGLWILSDKDYQKYESVALRKYRSARDYGSAPACYRLAHAFEDGSLELKTNRSQYLSHLKKAAAKKHGVARYELFELYWRGDYDDPPLVRENDRTALRYLRESAEVGYIKAMEDWARILAKGHYDARDRQVIERDPAESNRWLESAAELGSAKALMNLGVNRLSGDGQPKDTESGVSMLDRALEQGIHLASLHLGNHFLQLNDYEKARSYLQIAWERSVADADAAFTLGQWLEQGVAGEINETVALECYRFAAKKRHHQARKLLDELGLSY